MNYILEEQQHRQKYDRFFLALERLLKLETAEVKTALDEATRLMAEMLMAEQVDIFLHDPQAAALVAVGPGETASGKRLRTLGMNRLSLLHGGYPVKAFLNGGCALTGHLEREPDHLVSMTNADGLHIRSEIVVALEVNGERQGVLVASSSAPDFFSEEDLHFLEAVARWIGIIIHRAELIEQVSHGEVQPCLALHLLLGKSSSSSRKILAGEIVLDLEARQAWRNGHLLPLTRREYSLLEVLARNAGQVVTRECIFERVWSYDSETSLEIVKVYMNHLRAKLNAGGGEELIHTLRGVGYMLKA
ncbi:MAG TPA: winged helix-turn-helix domain-containing protein [Ktedonobacteraceae bacterium]|nr:winged helix-turn-helix domain-containing protein [Ktedonobacteraceae bacterium]